MPDLSRILLIDDDPALLRCLTEMLRLRLPHFDVETCASPLDALTRIASATYSLVISDLRMPEMGGLDMVRSIKAINPRVPVVLITGAMPDDDMRDSLRSLGVVDVIDKPLERNAFVDVILKAIQ